MNLAISALKAVGPDPAKIRDHIENTKGFVGMHGHIQTCPPPTITGLTRTDLEMIVVKGREVGPGEMRP